MRQGKKANRLSTFFAAVSQQLLRRSGQNMSRKQCLGAVKNWLCKAQDWGRDDGFSIRYSLIRGWGRSYPETTGYIIPTLLKCADVFDEKTLAERARRAAVWEQEIQNPDGSFNGGEWGGGLGPFVFDTGQVIFGLITAYRRFKEENFLASALRAGEWLLAVQEAEGYWSRFAYNGMPHTYYTRVAWALAELGKAAGKEKFIAAGVRNGEWCTEQQRENGWFDNAGFDRDGHKAPLTHTIAYTVRGLMELGESSGREEFIVRALRSAEALRDSPRNAGLVAATFDSGWRPASRYSCLTGNCQIAIILFKAYDLTGDKRYLDAGKEIVAGICRVQQKGGRSEIGGAIAGSSPIWGGYERLAFPNWAAKFFADAILWENRYAKHGSEHIY